MEVAPINPNNKELNIKNVINIAYDTNNISIIDIDHIFFIVYFLIYL